MRITMNMKSKEHENHLAEIAHLLSMYQTLSLAQLAKLYPELPKTTLFSLIRRLERAGRLTYSPETDMVLHTKDSIPNEALSTAFWVLLDFRSEITYHTVSEFPVSLTFYTQTDSYDVIYVPEEKELLINHALSAYPEDAPRRLVIVSHSGQIPLINFPGIAAFCTVTDTGQVQYYKKQGVTDS